MHKQMPSSAVCRGCRYALRELETTICPECGRAFDPGDAGTYIIDAQIRRRRRVVRWMIILLVLGVFVFVFCPRGVRRGMIVYNFNDGTVMTVKRWEPLPPKLLPIRYPGLNWTWGEPVEAPFTISVDSMMEVGSVSGSTNIPGMQIGLVPEVNGTVVTAKNGSLILKQLASKGTRGISIGSVPTDDDSRARMEAMMQQLLQENLDD